MTKVCIFNKSNMGGIRYDKSLVFTCARPGMKAIPRFREAIAFLKLRHQPAHIKYPLVALQVASNPGIYSASQLNVKDDVRIHVFQM